MSIWLAAHSDTNSQSETHRGRTPIAVLTACFHAVSTADKLATESQDKTEVAGSSKARPSRSASVNVVGKRSRLADAATSDRPAAAATAAACAASEAASAAPAAATASAAPSKFFAELGLCGVLLVEDIERRQAHVGDFLLTESDDLRRHRILRRYIRHRTGRRCGSSAAGHRQRHPCDSQHGHRFTQTLPLRSALRVRHGKVLRNLRANVRRKDATS